jgi:hypothetical protein
LCILPTPSKLSISHEPASSWNIPFKYMWSSTFMELPSHLDMHLIACSKKLFVVCSVFFSMDSSYLVESDCEKKCIGLINDVQFITHIHAVKCAFELQNRWSHSQSWWCASFQCSFKCTYTITSVRSHSHVSEGNPRWRDEDVLQVQYCSTISLGGVHLFNIHLHSIVCPH